MKNILRLLLSVTLLYLLVGCSAPSANEEHNEQPALEHKTMPEESFDAEPEPPPELEPEPLCPENWPAQFCCVSARDRGTATVG